MDSFKEYYIEHKEILVHTVVCTYTVKLKFFDWILVDS